jgi:hypothetical protein
VVRRLLAAHGGVDVLTARTLLRHVQRWEQLGLVRREHFQLGHREPVPGAWTWLYPTRLGMPGWGWEPERLLGPRYAELRRIHFDPSNGPTTTVRRPPPPPRPSLTSSDAGGPAGVPSAHQLPFPQRPPPPSRPRRKMEPPPPTHPLPDQE